jgi:hypothetical protein
MRRFGNVPRSDYVVSEHVHCKEYRFILQVLRDWGKTSTDTDSITTTKLNSRTEFRLTVELSLRATHNMLSIREF